MVRLGPSDPSLGFNLIQGEPFLIVDPGATILSYHGDLDLPPSICSREYCVICMWVVGSECCFHNEERVWRVLRYTCSCRNVARKISENVLKALTLGLSFCHWIARAVHRSGSRDYSPLVVTCANAALLFRNIKEWRSCRSWALLRKSSSWIRISAILIYQVYT